MLRILETVMNTAPGCSLAAKRLLNRISPRKRRSLYEPLPSDGLSANRKVRWISGSRVNRYSQVISCSSTWTSRRTEHGVWPSGVFIFCASLASTRGGALDPALHSQSLVAGHGPAPTRILARSPGGRATSLLLSQAVLLATSFCRYICTADVHPKPCFFQLTIQI